MQAICATVANSDHMPLSPQSYTASRRWTLFIPSGVMLLAITYLSIFKTPVPVALQDVALLDKWGHMLAYAVWTVCLLADFSRARIRHTYILSAAIAVLYGGLMELMQYLFCPLRQGEWLDWLADCIGVVLALLLFAGVRVLISNIKCQMTNDK